MAILSNRIKVPNIVTEFLEFCFSILRNFFPIILLILSIHLVSYPDENKKFSNISMEVSSNALSLSSSIFKKFFDIIAVIGNNLYYFKEFKTENEQLTSELARLQLLLAEFNSIQKENIALKKLLNISEETKYKHINAKLLSISVNPIKKTMLLAAGKNQAVEIEQIVTYNKILVGRIIEVSDNYSKVLLLNDINSRIPIVTSSSRIRGVLAGNNQNAEIIYLPEKHPIEIGEIVYSSGDGILYPPGLIVGKVSNLDNNIVQVNILEDFRNADFVTIYIADSKNNGNK